MMLDKKKKTNLNSFLWVQMGGKAVETTRKISNAFGPRIAKEHTVQWWFKKFCRRKENLEVWPSEVVSDQLRVIIEADLLQLQENLLKNSTSTILGSFAIWIRLKRWKSLRNGCLMSCLKIYKMHHFEVPSSLILHNNKPFLNWIVMCDKKIDFIQQLWMTSSVVGWRRSSKAFPKTKRAPKKGHGHCLVACCQSDPLQLSEFQ